MLRAACCCTAFFGFLYISEFTMPSQQSYNPLYHLSLLDIALDNRHAPTTVRLHIKQLKTDPLRKGAYIYLPKTNQQVCPIVRYLTIRGRKKGHCLFWYMFASAVTKILYKLDLNAQLYNTHSFCIGPATSTNQAGITDFHSKTLGRWRSNAYQRYITISPASMASTTKYLISKPTKHL